MLANRQRDTTPELYVRRALHARGRRFRVNYSIRVDGFRPVQPDIVFTRARVAVFVDGCFWHHCPDHGATPRANASWWQEKFKRTVARDRRDDRRLAGAGWTVVRVWEHELPAEAVRRIEAAITESSDPQHC